MKSRTILIVLCFCTLTMTAFISTRSDVALVDSRSVDDDTTSCTSENLIEDTTTGYTGSSGSNANFVTCIPPSTYPSFLTTIKGYSSNPESETTHYIVYHSTSTVGPPTGSAVWNSEDMVIPDGSWQTIDVSGEPEFETPITEGSWCIGIFTPAGTSIFARKDTDGTQGGGYFYNNATFPNWTHSTSNGDLHYRGISETCEDCACYIDGECYAEGDRGDDPHNVCDPAAIVNDWTFDSCPDLEMIEDNGVTNGGVRISTYAFVTCIKPDYYPSFLLSIKGVSVNLSSQTTQYVVYRSTGDNGPPDVSTVWTSEDMVPPDEAWETLDVSAESAFQVPLTSGSWCIGINLPSTSPGIYAGQDTGTGQSGGLWHVKPNGTVEIDPQFDLLYRGRYQFCDDCSCYIDGECWIEGDTNPANVCEICDSSRSVGEWSDNDGVSCDDGFYCNGTDTCSEGTCSHEGDPCDAQCQSCNESTDACVNTTGSCDDGVFCNGLDTCSGGSCSEHAGNTCDAQCQSCNEDTDVCDNADGYCDDGLFCNGEDTCSGGSCSEHAGDPCDAQCQSCNEDTNACDSTTGSCDDGVFCNGEDTCSGGSCSEHAGDPCDAQCQSCNEDTITCDNVDAYCDDGDFCNGEDTCVEGSCSEHDGDPCDSQCQSCNEGTDSCDNLDGYCDDGLFCNGEDTCAEGSCSEHDGDPCDSQCQSCNEGTDSCDNLDGYCDDGLFCNGEDACLDGSCSDHFGDPCAPTTEECNEETDNCDRIEDDTVDDDTAVDDTSTDDTAADDTSVDDSADDADDATIDDTVDDDVTDDAGGGDDDGGCCG